MTKEMQTLALAPVGNLESYIRAANTWPMLTAEEEKELAEKLHYQGDLEAAKKLILSHLRFVVHIARNYAGYGLPQADLIQEGNIGLMKAVRRFNPEVGVRLVSFAVHWIKAEIHEYVLRNWRIVKVATTKAQRKLFFNLRKTKQRLGWFNQDEVEMVARELGVSSKDVREMESRMAAQDMTFAIKSKQDVEQAMDSVERMNEATGQTVGELQHIAEAMERNVSQAVMSLQFQDMVTQLIGHVAKRLDELHEIMREIEGASGIVEQGAATGIAPPQAERLRGHLDSVCTRLDRLKETTNNNPVCQQSFASGEVELF